MDIFSPLPIWVKDFISLDLFNLPPKLRQWTTILLPLISKIPYTKQLSAPKHKFQNFRPYRCFKRRKMQLWHLASQVRRCAPKAMPYFVFLKTWTEQCVLILKEMSQYYYTIVKILLQPLPQLLLTVGNFYWNNSTAISFGDEQQMRSVM